MSKKEAKKFAKTKHKGLPEKVEEAVTGGSTPNLPAGVVKFVDELPQRIQQTLAGAKAKPATKPVKEAAECEMDEKPKLKKSEGGVEDPREIPTKINLAKNKMRAMGLKMSYEPEGEQIDELNRLEREQGKESGGSSDPAVRAVKKTIRGMEGKPAGQQKKVPGQKKKEETSVERFRRNREYQRRTSAHMQSSPRD